MELEAVILSNLVQEQKNKYHMFSLISKWEVNDGNSWTHRGEQHTLGWTYQRAERGRRERISRNN